jgi:hypothetical protein
LVGRVVNMSNYFLMHEDIRLAVIVISECNQISKVMLSDKLDARSHLPIGVTNEQSLIHWLLDRGVPSTRESLKLDFQIMKISTPFEYMLQNHGISLTDHYWLCEQDEEYNWKSINTYTNNFKSAYSLDLRSDKKTIQGKPNYTPSATLRGNLKKKWIIDNNGVRQLIKDNFPGSCRQSLCEVLVTQLHSQQNKFNYTPYNLINITSDNQQVIGCMCPNFTSVETEFIPAIDIVESQKKPNDISYYEFFLRLCYNQGLDIRKFLEYQIMTDFIISNSDRHLNNFGIIRRSDTLQWLGYAPIFDSGNSMFYDSDYVPVDKALLKIKVSSFLSKEVDLLKYVHDRSLVNIESLPDDNYVYSLLSKDINTKDEITQRLMRAYNRKIKYFSDFQNGANIWDYRYKG